jgi:predicted NACHT family NTPase
MSKRSLKLSREGIKISNKALKSKSWSKEYLAGHVSLSSSTIHNFFAGKPVDRTNFSLICDALALNVQELADLSPDVETESENTKQDSSFDIDALVLEVRQKIQNNIVTRCGTIRVLDMSQPLGLNHIYTKVNILEKITGRRRKKIPELLQEYTRENFDRVGLSHITEERVPGLDAVRKYAKLIILGKPGAGKTTFLKSLAIECILGDVLDKLVPIFVTLKDWAEVANPVSFLEYANQQAAESGVTYTQMTNLFSSGRVLFLLDGLDEVQQKDTLKVLKEIRELSDQLSNNHFVITCRIAAKEYTLEKFTEVEVADFDEEQIQTFVTKWFKAKDSDLDQQFLQRLNENKPIQELASNPLLLTLMCLEFEDAGEFPNDRAELYKRATNTLLRKWDAKRGIQRDIVYHQLSVQRKENLLSHIALTTFEKGDYFFKQRQVEQYIADYIKNLSEVETDLETLQLDSEAVLKSIEAQHGLLVERARGIYSFSHLTFQEYFTARSIVNSANPQVIDDPALQGLIWHTFDKRWREVFLLVAEMLLSADIFLLSMKHTIDLWASQHRPLQELLTWANQKSREVSTPYKEATVRAFYLSLVVGIHIIDNCDYPFNEVWQIGEISDLLLALDNSISLDFYHGCALGLGMGSFHGSLDPILALDLNLCHARAQASLIGRTASLEATEFSNFLAETDSDHLLDDTNFYTLTDALSQVFSCKIDSALEPSLLSLDNELPQGVYDDWERYNEWRKTRSLSWAEELRAVIMKHRHIDYKWQLTDEHWGMLRAYCYANGLLLNCLNSECYVNREVRQAIQSTLLLPFNEIERLLQA